MTPADRVGEERVTRTTLKRGDRAHHRSVGWGTVLQAVPQGDGSTEYEVQRDRALYPGGPNAPTWWPSYHLDEFEATA